MKKIFTILAVVLFSVSIFAQSPPQKMSYQAIIRNSSNAIVTSTLVGMKISILQASPMGGTSPVYVETQMPTTNINGLVVLEVGTGTVISGVFSAIDWANGPFFIKTETDPTGGTAYSITGTSQLLSVPYAFYAAKSGNGEPWILTGNGGAVSDANFIGTTTNIPFNIKVNNQKSGKIDPIKQNTFFGYLSGSGTSGTDNTAVGFEALYSNTTGNYNTAHGFQSLYSNTTGSYNTASGINALYSNISGDNNTAYGYDALNFNTTGTYNTALGQQALFHNTSGTNNTAVGLSALGYNTTGANSTAVGTSALLNSTGDENVAVGFNALFSNTTGTKNTALGTNAYMTGTLSNTTLIGYGATATLSNIIQLGNTSVADVRTAGTYTAGAVTYPNTIGTSGQVLTSPASGGNAYWSTPAAANPVHTIGESYGGGIVFYVYDNGRHGLIAATADQSTGIRWYNGTYRNTGTTGDGVAAGIMNTTLIIATQTADDQEGSYAAKVCADYSVTGIDNVYYGDWYLPSLMELNLLFLQKDAVGGFTTNFYWSSTEQIAPGHYYAWGKDFNGSGMTGANKFLTYNVRAIRAF